jgi:hypothetical protein
VEAHGYFTSNVVPEVVHELIEGITVLFGGIFRFREDVLSKSFPQRVKLPKVLGLRIYLLRNLMRSSSTASSRSLSARITSK